MGYVIEFLVVGLVCACGGFYAGFHFHNKIVKWFNKKKTALKEKL